MKLYINSGTLSAVVGICIGMAGIGLHSTVNAQEQQLTTNEIADYEFDWARDGVYCPTCNFGSGNSRLTYVDRNHRLWIANVDFNTGLFVPANGQGTLLDTNAAFTTDFGNGSEWMFSNIGSQVVYTKYQPGYTVGVVADAGSAVATQTGPTTWAAGFIENGLGKVSPLGSLDLNDTMPRMNYQEADNSVWWRYTNIPSSEAKVPNTDKDGATRSWVPGQQAIIFTAPPAVGKIPTPTQQVFTYNVATSTLTQLTNDVSTKFGAYMWYAPEYNGELLMWTMINRNAIEVYRNIAQRNGTMKWTPIVTIKGPAGQPYLWSPDLFVYNNKTYIFTVVSASSNPEDFSTSTDLAIMTIDPTNPTMTILTSGATDPSVRLDPEYFITATGPYLYYYRYAIEGTAGTLHQENQGVWRVNPNLGPPITSP